MADLTAGEKEELACTYAALILHGSNLPVTAASIQKIVASAGVPVQAFWPNLFERALQHKSLEDLISNVGSAPAPVAAAPAAAAAPAKAEQKKVEEKPKEPSEDLTGFDLFG